MKNDTGVNSRDWYLDIIRIMACVMVVGIHVSAEGWYDISPRSYNWAVLNFYDSVFRPGVPLFLMISGSLYLRKDRIDIKELWLKRILRLAVIYLVWVVFYAVISLGVRKAAADPRLVWKVVSGPKPQFHLWYLRMLINVYAVASLLWVLVRALDRDLVRYFFILFFFFGILRSTVYEMPFLPQWIHDQIDLFVDMDLVGYSAYFILGYYLSAPGSDDRFSTQKLLGIYGITLLLAVGVNQWIASAGNKPTEALYGHFALPVAIESCCLFLLVKKKFGKKEFGPVRGKWLVRLSSCTLFIYLAHICILLWLHLYLHLYAENYNVLFSIPLMIFLVFIISAAAGMVLERVPVLNKFL